MSSTYIATIVSVLAVVLPLLGVEVGTEALTTTAQTILVIVSGLWILKERYSRGDITIVGRKKN